MKITVLGATSELAEALIYKFAPFASKLNLTARKPSALLPLVADLKIRELCKNVETHAFDAQLLDIQQLTQLAADTDLLIVAVGYLGEQQKAARDDGEVDQILVTNFTGLARAMNVFVEKMSLQPGGFSKNRGIIGISSVAGERGRASNYFYGAAKAGFTAYLSGVRHRLFAHKINVLTVLPGFLNTKMTVGLLLPKRLTASPDRAAEHIFKAWQNGRRVVYVLPIWRLIMLIIKQLPEFIFLKLKL